jgi:hypothetical protein
MKQTLMILVTSFMMSSCAVSQTTVPLWKTLPDIPPMPQADEIGLAPVNDIKMYYAIFNREGKTRLFYYMADLLVQITGVLKYRFYLKHTK